MSASGATASTCPSARPNSPAPEGRSPSRWCPAAARSELSLRTVRHYEDVGLVIPSARSQGGLRLCTEAVARLMVVRRVKPLGFTLDEMRGLLEATDRPDAGDELPPAEREELRRRIHGFEQAARRRVEDLCVRPARAEEFAAALAERLTRTAAP